MQVINHCIYIGKIIGKIVIIINLNITFVKCNNIKYYFVINSETNILRADVGRDLDRIWDPLSGI